MSEIFLVTGVRGCIGAWLARQLVAEGADVVGYDIGSSAHRLDLVLEPADRGKLRLVDGDVTDADRLGRTLDEHEVTHVVHLAALQVPACRADPPLGARVNVVGTVNVFEAVKARRDRIGGVVFASSFAVYGPGDRGAVDERPRPGTLYGTYKRATEEIARVYWDSEGVPSTALRPAAVFGLGRDQGVTAAPTLAMAAAARGESFHIPFGGRVQLDYAPDVAAAFAELARRLEVGASVHNMPGSAVPMTEIVASIGRASGGPSITFDDTPLPFPQQLESDLELEVTPLDDAVADTVAAFSKLPAGER